MGRADATYHSAGDALGYRSNTGFAPDGASMYNDLWQQSVPGKRIEFFTPDMWWQESLQLFPTTGGGIFGESQVRDTVFKKAVPFRHSWNRAMFGPSFGPPEQRLWGAYRIKDNISVYLNPFTPTGDVGTTIWNWVGSSKLLRDGRVVGQLGRAAYGVLPVPSDDGVYTFEVQAVRDVAWSILGNKLDAQWTFRSARPDDELLHNLPFLIVKASGLVDEQDSALSGLPFLLGLEVQRQIGVPAARITELTLEVSYDDGATWQPVPVLFGGDRGLALLFHPPTPGTVSLRTRAKDAAGNGVVQTVGRAYRTRPWFPAPAPAP